MRPHYERAVFVFGPREVVSGAQRVYYGNEFCENLIPAQDAVKAVFRRARRKGAGFTFVTPFVTDRGLKRLEAPLSFLNSFAGVEVVLNDWGVLHLLESRFGNLLPVLGRLLTKQRRDPRISRILSGSQNRVWRQAGERRVLMLPKELPPTLIEHYQASVINVPGFQDFLASHRIGRVEIDNLVWDMNVQVPPGLAVSIYFPFGYIATGRMCWRTSLSYGSCRKACRSHFLRKTGSSEPVAFYGIGNTVLYESRRIDFSRLNNLKGLRIVHEPRLPF